MDRGTRVDYLSPRVDYLSTKVDYFLVAFIAGLLIAADAILTLVAVNSGVAVEANPLLNWSENLELVLAVKTWLSLIGLSALAAYAYPSGTRAARFARVGLWLIVGTYTLVNVYHLLGRILWA